MVQGGAGRAPARLAESDAHETLGVDAAVELVPLSGSHPSLLPPGEIVGHKRSRRANETFCSTERLLLNT